jgi:predicted ABC-class ATPase
MAITESSILQWERLRDKLITLEGKPFAAYQALEGGYRFDKFVLFVDRIGAEPGAPSPMRVRIDQGEARFPPELSATRAGKMALEDFTARRWIEGVRRIARARGGRPVFTIDVGGQEVLERTACRITDEYVEIRGGIWLPSENRKVAAKATQAAMLEDLPQIVDGALIYANQNAGAVQRHRDAADDHEALRAELATRGLVAFLADGAVLPREGGTDRPLLSRLVPLAAPPELRVSVTLPHQGPVTGMGIPRGVTVVIGGEFSGRTTLLRAIAASVYPHLPGDGREHCATVADAVLVRTDEGRRVEGVNLTPFVTALPGGEDPSRCRMEHAGGVVSQAAAIAEALEVGCALLLVDEDTSAGSLMVHDPIWRRLAPEARHPVTPLSEIVRPLYEEHGVSSIIAAATSVDYVRIADTVIAADNFKLRVVTADAKQAASQWPEPPAAARGRFGGIQHRIPLPDSLNPLRGRKLRGDGGGPGQQQWTRMVTIGREAIDLSKVEQMVDPAQAKAIAAALIFAADRGLADGGRTIREILGLIEMEVAQHGLEGLVPDGPIGDLAAPRKHEFAAALNRLRTLRVKS